MILSDSEILKAIDRGDIVIDPFDRKKLGSNSYDVSLSENLAVYDSGVLDAKKHNKINHFKIPEEGIILQPRVLYLGSTVEYTETRKHVPFLDGKSSIGRLGIIIHFTAGAGDDGFCNYWTLEISVIKPVKIYAGMIFAQLRYFEIKGDVLETYDQKGNAKYRQRDDRPKESMMWRNFE